MTDALFRKAGDGKNELRLPAQYRKFHPVPKQEFLRERVWDIVDGHVVNHHELTALEQRAGVAEADERVATRCDRQCDLLSEIAFERSADTRSP